MYWFVSLHSFLHRVDHLLLFSMVVLYGSFDGASLSFIGIGNEYFLLRAALNYIEYNLTVFYRFANRDTSFSIIFVFLFISKLCLRSPCLVLKPNI